MDALLGNGEIELANLIFLCEKKLDLGILPLSFY